MKVAETNMLIRMCDVTKLDIIRNGCMRGSNEQVAEKMRENRDMGGGCWD